MLLTPSLLTYQISDTNVLNMTKVVILMPISFKYSVVHELKIRDETKDVLYKKE